MDYPLSVPGVGLVGGKFSDGNPLLGQQASLDPAAWANQVTDELLNVLVAAGIAPSEAESNQLLLALRAAGVFTTPAQFDASTKAATMGALQRALGNFQNQISKNSSTTLTATEAGSVINLISGAVNTTLPLLSSVPKGAAFKFVCTGQVGASVLRNGSDSMSANGSVQTSFTLDLGDTLTVVSAGTLWLATDGTARDKFAGAYNASLASNGYQKFPSGQIEQWGSFVVPALATGAVSIGAAWEFTLPTTFPSGCFQVLASFANPNAGTTGAEISGNKIYLKNSHTAAQAVRFFAKGN